MRLRALLLILAPALLVGTLPALAQNSAPATSPEERAALHSGPDWALIAPHLPDPQTATASDLETAADVLRARRFPEDALDYYGYALTRGGNVSQLMNKMGIVRLELRQVGLAHEMFLRTVRAKKKDAQAWNNLGVTEYATQHYLAAVADYKKAARLDKRSAVYHSNAGMAYFELKDMESARKELALAIKIDPAIMQSREGGGSTAHVLGTQNYPELCFQMASLYARSGDLPSARVWLAKASEGGFDVRDGMRKDVALQAFAKDPEVRLILANTAQLRSKHTASGGNAPSLGPGAPTAPPVSSD